MNERELLPCPFCGGRAEFERRGTPRQSCIVVCTNCGCRHESSDEDDESGSSWNDRAALQSAPGQEPVGPVAEVETVYVRPNADGKYRAIVVSDERLSQGAELFVHPPNSATVEAETIERIAALLYEEATDEQWTVAGVEHNGPDRGYYRKLARKVVALALQPAQQAHDWSDAPQGATHYQPHQRAYYKRISATEWYVWSRINNGEPRRWLYSAGTGDSGEWIVRSATTPQAEAQAGESVSKVEHARKCQQLTGEIIELQEQLRTANERIAALESDLRFEEEEATHWEKQAESLRAQLAAQPQAVDFDLFREVPLIHQKHADWEAITTLAADDPSYDTFAAGFKTAVGVIEQHFRALRNAGKEEA